MKLCSGCNINKDLSDFKIIKRRGKECYSTKCVICYNEYYRLINKKSYMKNRDKRIYSQKQYTENNKDKIAIQRKQFRENNKEKIKLEQKEKYIRNKKKYIENANQYYSDNKEHLDKKRNERRKFRIKNEPLFKLKQNLSCLIKSSIRNKGIKPNTNTLNILGCSINEFKQHLESRFEPWMDWENRGLYNGTSNHGWDIDHIIPLATAITEDDVYRLNHYTNLQPLCSYINRDIKRDNYPHHPTNI